MVEEHTVLDDELSSSCKEQNRGDLEEFFEGVSEVMEGSIPAIKAAVGNSNGPRGTVLDDEPLPSQEEIEEFVQTVNEVIEAISGAVETLSSVLAPSIRAISLTFLRLALAVRLSAMWDNRAWHWLSWRIAQYTPVIFISRLLPTRFLAGGLIRDYAEEGEDVAQKKTD